MRQSFNQEELEIIYHHVRFQKYFLESLLELGFTQQQLVEDHKHQAIISATNKLEKYLNTETED